MGLGSRAQAQELWCSGLVAQRHVGLPGQGSNLCLPNWQVDSLPLNCCCCCCFSRVRLCVTHRRQPTRLPRPWDSPDKNTGVGCHFLLQGMKVKRQSEVAQSCLTLSDPMECSLPGSSVHGIFQARVLEWGAIAFSTELLGKPYYYFLKLLSVYSSSSTLLGDNYVDHTLSTCWVFSRAVIFLSDSDLGIENSEWWQFPKWWKKMDSSPKGVHMCTRQVCRGTSMLPNLLAFF